MLGMHSRVRRFRYGRKLAATRTMSCRPTHRPLLFPRGLRSEGGVYGFFPCIVTMPYSIERFHNPRPLMAMISPPNSRPRPVLTAFGSSVSIAPRAGEVSNEAGRDHSTSLPLSIDLRFYVACLIDRSLSTAGVGRYN
jgi:hypothetical protein